MKPVLSNHSKEDKNRFSRLVIALGIALKVLQNAPLLTCIKLPPVFMTFILSTFEWPLKTGLTVIVLAHAFVQLTTVMV